MPLNVFTIAGELKADTTAFERSLRSAENELRQTSQKIEETEDKARELGQTSATTARSFEKLRESVSQSRSRLDQAADAFKKGAINSREFAQVLNQTGNAAGRMETKLKDASARMQDLASKKPDASLGRTVTFANLAAGAIENLAGKAKDFVVEGGKMYASLDKLTRLTARLDENFQSPIALKKLQDDFKKLAVETGQDAEDIAKASFTIKSAFSDLSREDLSVYLREFGDAATTSGISVSEHADNVAALAKQYNIGKEGLRGFSAMLNTAYGQALAKDSEVAKGFNEVLNAAKSTKQPFNDLIAAMSTLQGATGDAAGNTTLLKNAYSKLTDGNYQKGFEAIGISVFDVAGNYRNLNDIIGDVAKSMEGLNDKQINEKFGFMNQKEAREAFLTLARYHDAYDKTLADGAGTQAFNRNHALMFDAVESRWARLWNNIKNDQSGAGGYFSKMFLSAFDSTTVLGGITIFFNNIGSAVLQGIVRVAQFAYNSIMLIPNAIAQAFGVDTTGLDQRMGEFFNSISDKIGDLTNDNRRIILEKQKKMWQDIAASTANPETRLKAEQNIQSLTKSLQSNLNESAVTVYEGWEKIGKQAAEGLKSGDAKIKQQAEKSLIESLKGIQEAINNPSFSEGIKKDFQKLFTELTTGANLPPELQEKIRQQFGDLQKLIADSAKTAFSQQNLDFQKGYVDSIVKGLKSGDAAIKKEAAASGKNIAGYLNDVLKNLQIDPVGNAGMIEAVKKLLADLEKAMTAAGVNMEKIGATLGKNFLGGVVQTIVAGRGMMNGAVAQLCNFTPSGGAQMGMRIGVSIWQGVVNGINSGRGAVSNASASLMRFSVVKPAENAVQTASPSKVFTRIGQYIGEGLVIGLNDKRENVAKASTDLFKAVMATAKDVTAKIKAQVKELTKSLKELNTENAVTVEGFTQTVGFRVSLAEGEKLKNQMQEIIDLQIKLGMTPVLNVANLGGQLGDLQRFEQVFDGISDTIAETVKYTPSLRDMLALFSNENAQKGLDELAKKFNLTREKLLEMIQAAKQAEDSKFWDSFLDNSTRPRREQGDAKEDQGVTSDFPEISALNEIVPQIKQRWDDFFATFRAGIEGMKANLPSLKESLGENLLNVVNGISDVFGNAVQNWDGTIRGFFQSVAQGFAQMAKQIIADIIRLLIYKAIMKFIGSFTGGGGGSAGDIGSIGGAAPGHARGGLINGEGTSTSDSIFARLSNGEFVMQAKAVAHFGADFFQRLNNLQTPAFASGGMVGGGVMSNSSTVNNNQRAQNFYINVSGGGSNQQNQQTASMIKRELISAMRKEEQRNR